MAHKSSQLLWRRCKIPRMESAGASCRHPATGKDQQYPIRIEAQKKQCTKVIQPYATSKILSKLPVLHNKICELNQFRNRISWIEITSKAPSPLARCKWESLAAEWCPVLYHFHLPLDKLTSVWCRMLCHALSSWHMAKKWTSVIVTIIDQIYSPTLSGA